MVNPNKHNKNLNDDDLNNIYDKLNQQYKRTRDFNTKKEINQQIIILILLCRRFPVNDITKINYKYFNAEPPNTILFTHLKEQLTNNFCDVDGLLLTNRQDNALKVDDIDRILSNIDTGSIDKQITAKSLTITNSKLNDYGKLNFNKKKIRQYLDLQDQIAKMKEVLDKSEDKQVDLSQINQKLEEIYDNISAEIGKISIEDDVDKLTRKINEIEDQQAIIIESLTNKYNQLSKTVSKIHQNTKSTNKQYNQLNNKLDNIKIPEKTDSDDYESEYWLIKNKLESIESMIEKNMEGDNMNNTSKATTSMDYNIPCNSKKIPNSKFKEFMFRWFSNNIKITKSTRDAIDLDEIIRKLEKYLESEDISLDRDALINRLESYLKVWYNTKSTHDFSMIKSQGISGNEFYSNLRFIDIKQERENKIKNSIIEWIKEHTRKKAGSKTYTKDILDNLKPLFEQNGWIITGPEDVKQLQEAGFQNVCVSRTFSQIIGKAMLEVYKNIQTERDNYFTDGYITWYADIEIINKKVSENLNSKISNELSDSIFTSDNLIYNWLNENIIYTGDIGDTVHLPQVYSLVDKLLVDNNINLSSDILEVIVSELLDKYIEEHSETVSADIEYITSFRLKKPKNDMIEDILYEWTSNHLVVTDNMDDKVYFEDINEKLLTQLYHENITIVPDDIYQQIPSYISDNFLTQSQYIVLVEDVLKKQLGECLESIDGSYYPNVRMIKFHTLKPEHITGWISENIETLLKSHVEPKEYVFNTFREYLAKNNIKNETKHSIEKLVNTAIQDYYKQKDSMTLITNAMVSDEEYYIIKNV